MPYRGSAYIVLGCWIDAEDHMHIEHLAVGEKQCPPFVNVLQGCTAFYRPPEKLPT